MRFKLLREYVNKANSSVSECETFLLQHSVVVLQGFIGAKWPEEVFTVWFPLLFCAADLTSCKQNNSVQVTRFMMPSHMLPLWQWASKQLVTFIELITFQAWWIVISKWMGANDIWEEVFHAQCLFWEVKQTSTHTATGWNREFDFFASE